MTSQLRVGLLGCGGIGQRHGEAISLLTDRMRLVACCGRTADRVAAFSAGYGATPYTDFASMLDRESLDLLILALPPFAHSGQLEQAAAHGVHILAEKPIALDLQRARSMVAACERAGVVAACGFMARHGAAVRRFDELVSSGATGSIGQFSGSFHCNSLHAPWWRHRALGGGQMVEQLIHIVDLARHWLGMPDTVYARASNLFHRDTDGYDIDDVSTMVLGYSDGRMASITASNGAVPGRWTKHWQLICTQMTATFSSHDDADLVTTLGASLATETVRATTDVFKAQLIDVASAIETGRQPKATLRDGLDTLRIVLAARSSADESCELTL